MSDARVHGPALIWPAYAPSAQEQARDYVPRYPVGYVPRDIAIPRHALTEPPRPRGPGRPPVGSLAPGAAAAGRARGAARRRTAGGAA